MGFFLDPQEAKDKAVSDLIRQMDLEALDDLYIYPAEAMIAEALNLQLDTDNDPQDWAARFDQWPELRTEFQTAYKRATMLTINRMSVNPHGFVNQSVGGANVTYNSSAVPREAKALMTKWSKPRMIFRA